MGARGLRARNGVRADASGARPSPPRCIADAMRRHPARGMAPACTIRRAVSCWRPWG